MDKYLQIANYFLGEEYQVTPGAGANTVPNTGILRNDFNSIFPHGFTTDATMLSEKELEGVIEVVASNDFRHLNGYKKQCEDNIATLKTMGQKNRIDDLEVRLFIVDKAIAKKNQGAIHPEN